MLKTTVQVRLQQAPRSIGFGGELDEETLLRGLFRNMDAEAFELGFKLALFFELLSEEEKLRVLMRVAARAALPDSPPPATGAGATVTLEPKGIPA